MPNSALASTDGGGGITALTGDVTASGAGSQAATIPTSVISTFMRTVTDDANAAAARATLGIVEVLNASLAADFDATNTATLATALTLTTTATGSYFAIISIGVATGGVNTAAGAKIAIGGSAVLAANSGLTLSIFDDNQGTSVQTTGFLSGAPGTLYNASDAFAAPNILSVRLLGTLVVSTAGTITIEFAQSVADAATSSVLAGTTITLIK